MSDTDQPEDDAPPDPAAGAPEDFTTGRLADALRPPLPPEAIRAITEQMSTSIGSWAREYVSSLPKFDSSPTWSAISASLQSTGAGISEAVLNLGESARGVDMAKLFKVETPKMPELVGMPKVPEFPVPEGISAAARRFTENLYPHVGGGVGSHIAAAALGGGLSGIASGLKLGLPPLSSSVADFVRSQVSGRELLGGRDPERMLGLNLGSFLPADSPLLNITPFGGVHEALGLQLAQYVPSATVSAALRRWMPGESIAESLSAFWRLADRGLPAAQVALGEALSLVAALQRGDIGVTERVKQFLITWLRFGEVSLELVASAVLVLHNTARWLPADVRDFDPRKKLRSRILVEHRKASRLSTDPDLRFRGHPLRSLQEPIGDDEETGTVITLADRVADPHAVDPAAQVGDEFVDPWMRELWWKFTDRERTILRAKSQQRVTWAEAAVECGGTPAEGEALRRKGKRLSKLDLAGKRPGRAVS